MKLCTLHVPKDNCYSWRIGNVFHTAYEEEEGGEEEEERHGEKPKSQRRKRNYISESTSQRKLCWSTYVVNATFVWGYKLDADRSWSMLKFRIRKRSRTIIFVWVHGMWFQQFYAWQDLVCSHLGSISRGSFLSTIVKLTIGLYEKLWDNKKGNKNFLSPK